MRKLLITLLVVLMTTPALFAAAGHRHALILPADDSRAGDSAWATVNALTDYINLTGFAKCNLTMGISSWDSDIDSVSFITRVGNNKDGPWIVVDSQELAAAGYLCKVLVPDSLHGAYLQTIVRVFGDAAGSSTQTIVLYAHALLKNNDNDILAIKGEKYIDITFTE